MNRREAMTAVAALGLTGAASAATGEIPQRPFGKSGEKISAIGLGGHHIGRPKDAQEGIRIIHAALDRGITFMDNCWDYHDGESERRMGEALKGGYRKKAFLMTKFDSRTKPGTAKQIDESLQRLQTDVIDLMQYHENIRLEDPDRFFAPNGPLEALMVAKKAGKIRFIGFTGHKDPLVHVRMLEVADKHGFHFDACQMPLNVMDAHFRSFGSHVVPKLVEKGIAVLGMKPLGDGNVLKSNTVSAIECLHYAMNLPTATVITGCESMERLDQAVQAAKTFKPMSKQEVAALLSKTQRAAMNGEFEPFKTTAKFDGTASHPQWMA